MHVLSSMFAVTPNFQSKVLGTNKQNKKRNKTFYFCKSLNQQCDKKSGMYTFYKGQNLASLPSFIMLVYIIQYKTIRHDPYGIYIIGNQNL